MVNDIKSTLKVLTKSTTLGNSKTNLQYHIKKKNGTINNVPKIEYIFLYG